MVEIGTEIGTEEGDLCGRFGCTGHIEWQVGKNCSCHLSPPCMACVTAPLMCSECGWEEGDDD
ncbi:MAG TPA: hypothetical protein DDW89_09845 [Gammaproteobacteria bacterium]|nr:hypothetical protein [Gammaproteobacteria bacterium]